MSSKTNPPLFDDITQENDTDFTYKSKMEASRLRSLTLSLSQGDQKAWEELYLHLADSLINFLNQLIHSYEDASDVSQEIFIYLWENHHKINPQKNIKSYLYTIARSYAYDFLKEKRRNNVAYSLSDSIDPAILDHAPDDFVIADEMKILIRMSLESMPKQQRRIFEMSRYEGLSNDAIAKALNITPATVSNYIYAATKELKKLFAALLIFLTI